MSDVGPIAAEKHLLQDRDACLGRIIRDLVHAVNNQLSAILGYAELLQMNPAASAFASELEQVITSGTEGMDLMRSLTVVRNGLAGDVEQLDASRQVEASVSIFCMMHHSKQVQVENRIQQGLMLNRRGPEFAQAVFHLAGVAYQHVLAVDLAQRKIDMAMESRGNSLELELKLSPLEGQPVDKATWETTVWALDHLCIEPDRWSYQPAMGNITLSWKS